MQLFVIDDQTRSIASMIEIAELVRHLGKSLLLRKVAARKTAAMTDLTCAVCRVLCAVQISEGFICVVVIKELPDGATIGGHVCPPSEIKDLNRARAYLADVVQRNGFPVFDEVVYHHMLHTACVGHLFFLCCPCCRCTFCILQAGVCYVLVVLF